MPELNPVAVTSADLLRAIAAGGWTTRSELAEAAGRSPKNIARDLSNVEGAGLVAVDPDLQPLAGITLTDHGREQLAAIARAEHGGEKRKPRGRWPVDRIVRNPANRVPRDVDVAALADTIESAEDVLQDVLLTPPDANGVRMLLAGEHRWRAVQLLAEQDRLPAALADGLPFRERQASTAEQILIRIVENTARADLSPLEDARQLLALQRETNWSAREIAKKTGRSPADSDTGVRDVQVKIKVAKEATPEALAEYERTGSWDALRDSVTQPKPRATPEQELRQALAESGPATLAVATEHKPDGAAFRDATVATFDFCLGNDPVPVIRLHRHSLPDGRVGWGWNVSQLPGRTNPEVARGPREFLPNSDLARNRAISQLRHLHREALPIEAVQWLDRQMGPHYVDGVDCYNASIAGERRRALGWEKRKANSGGGATAGGSKPKPPAEPGIVIVEPTAADAEAGSPTAADASADDRDIWDRDHNAIVADEATLRRVEDFTLSHTGAASPGYAHQLLNVLGLEGPFGADENGNLFSDVVGRLQPRAFATIDVDAEGPPQRARAIALLVAWALNRTFNEERAK